MYPFDDVNLFSILSSIFCDCAQSIIGLYPAFLVDFHLADSVVKAFSFVMLDTNQATACYNSRNANQLFIAAFVNQWCCRPEP